MKTIVESKENTMDELLEKRVTFFCMNYIYTGKLTAFDKTWAVLSDAGIVYETGKFSDKEWKDFQPMPNPVRVRLSSVESFMILK